MFVVGVLFVVVVALCVFVFCFSGVAGKHRFKVRNGVENGVLPPAVNKDKFNLERCVSVLLMTKTDSVVKK